MSGCRTFSTGCDAMLLHPPKISSKLLSKGAPKSLNETDRMLWKRWGNTIRGLGRLLFASVLSMSGMVLAAQSPTDQLAEMEFEQLLNSAVTVSSVSRRPGSVQHSPAAITVLTQEDIRRSGATSIPEMLRLVPGMNVARVDSHQWAVSTRGFNDLFANKILVMMDGRSVYTSLFSGTFWDVQDTVIDDIDRIEVIRGPGASLWGANAVNGVINVISKSAANTQGLLVSAGVGTEERAFGSVRYGGKIGDYGHYRLFGKFNARDNSAPFGTGFPATLITLNLGGSGGTVASAAEPPTKTYDEWEMGRAGFRADWRLPGADRFVVQGEIHKAREHQLYQRITPLSFGTYFSDTADTASGGNLLMRWTHTFSNRADFILQTSFDRSNRELAILGEDRDTWNIDVQHQFSLGKRQTLVWGSGFRRIADTIRNSAEVTLDPSARNSELFSAFVQDDIAVIAKKLTLTIGSRLEHNDFTGLEVQPNIRLLWSLNPSTTLWSSVSRAVRTPSRAEDDLKVNYPGVPTNALYPGAPAITIAVQGSRRFDAENLIAYESGYRGQLADWLAVEATAFYNDYGSLRGFALGNTALDLSRSPVEILATIDNAATGEAYGGELSANFHVMHAWRLRANYSLLRTRIHSDSTLTLSSFGTESAEGSSPRHQFTVRSSFDLSKHCELDATIRSVGELPALAVPSYATLDLRFAWRPRKQVEISIVGQNLLDRQHPEFKPSFLSSQATLVQRGVYGKITVGF
jgi:iron complex outermembrane recepter protein